MHPDRVLVRDLVEPFRVPRPGMDERWQAERRKKQHLAFGAVDVVAMDVALDVAGNGILWPVPVFQRLRIKLEFARRSWKTGDRFATDLDPDWGFVLFHYMGQRINRAPLDFIWLQNLAVQFVDIVFNQESAVFSHVIERHEPFAGGGLRQTRNAVLKDPSVVLVDSELLSGTVRRFKVTTDAHRSIGIDPPRQLNPELIFLPNLAQSGLAMRFIGEVEFLALPLQCQTQHRLAKTDPACSMRFLAHQVVTLGSMAHGQNIIGKPGSFAPGWSETSVPPNLALVGQGL